MNDKIILIGGAPLSGKSYLARQLSEKLKVPWISTDIIRQIMRVGARPEDYPGLYYFKKDEAEKYIGTHSAEEFICDLNKQSEEIWQGVEKLVRKNHVWKSFIIEGVAILPKFINEKLNDFKDKIYPVFLIDKNRDRIKREIFKRGFWLHGEKYPDSVKEKEVEWVMAYNKWLKDELQKYPFPSLEIGDRNGLVEKVIELVQ